MDLERFIQYCLSGITQGSIYAIVAIGFNIIYNTTGIINFAQGEFVIVGAMLAISLAAIMPLPAAIALAVAGTMLLGALVVLVFIRPAQRQRADINHHHDRPVHPHARGDAAHLGAGCDVPARLHGLGYGHSLSRRSAYFGAGVVGAGHVRPDRGGADRLFPLDDHRPRHAGLRR